MENQPYQIRKNYQDQEPLRKSFEELAEKTFGLDFEPWFDDLLTFASVSILFL